MKKLLALILILSLAVPALALAEDKYTPALGMTMEEYIQQYNAIQSALGSPYLSLSQPRFWTLWEGYHVAWFKTVQDDSVTILLLSKEKEATSAGLDMITVFSTDNLIGLISTTDRCLKVFLSDAFGIPMSGCTISEAIRYYYENQLESKNLMSTRGFNSDTNMSLSFFHGDDYFFHILVPEV